MPDTYVHTTAERKEFTLFYAIVRLKEGYRPIAIIRPSSDDFGSHVGHIVAGPHELPQSLEILYADNFGSRMPCASEDRPVRLAQMVPGFITMGWRRSDTPPFPAHWLRDFRGLRGSQGYIEELQALGMSAHAASGALVEA